MFSKRIYHNSWRIKMWIYEEHETSAVWIPSLDSYLLLLVRLARPLRTYLSHPGWNHASFGSDVSSWLSLGGCLQWIPYRTYADGQHFSKRCILFCCGVSGIRCCGYAYLRGWWNPSWPGRGLDSRTLLWIFYRWEERSKDLAGQCEKSDS